VDLLDTRGEYEYDSFLYETEEEAKAVLGNGGEQ